MSNILNKLKLQIINSSIATSRILAGILFLVYILDLYTNMSKYQASLSGENTLSAVLYLASQFFQMLVFVTVLMSYSWIAEWFLKLVKEEINTNKINAIEKKIEEVKVVESKKKNKR